MVVEISRPGVPCSCPPNADSSGTCKGVDVRRRLQRLHLGPEGGRVAQLAGGQPPQPAVLFFQHEGASAGLDGVAVPGQDRVARRAPPQVEAVGRDGQVRAGRQAHQVLRPGERRRLVEVVDPPDEPPVAVAPGAEVLEVQIADGDDRRRAGHVAELLGPGPPQLAPPIKGGPHEEEGPLAHPLVLEAQVGAHQRDEAAKPLFVAARGPANVLHSRAV